MSERQSERQNLGDYLLGRKRNKRTALDDINELIDWKPIDSFLKKKLSRRANAVGNPAYPCLAMFKILLLQRWYNLSDVETEQAMNDRLSFFRFAGLSVEEDFPDATTICRFRNSLLERNVYQKLLDRLNRQLEKKGLLVREGAVVDASLVSSCRRPRKVIDVMPEDRKEEDYGPDAIVSYSDDHEAAWLVKGKKAHYGYKIHTATDSQDGFVLGGHVTPANRSDTRELETVLDEISVAPGACVFADKGYCSRENRAALQARGLTDGIMAKAARNRELSPEERIINRVISRGRAVVERAFGTLKRGYGFCRSRYLGRVKVELEFFLNAMAFNLKKAVPLVRF